MHPELQALLLVIAITDVVGVVSALLLSPRRLALARVATVALLPIVGTVIQLVSLQFRAAEQADRDRAPQP